MKIPFAPVLFLAASFASAFAQTEPLIMLMKGSYSEQTSPLAATGPTITTNPASQYVNPGAGVYFNVFATTSGGTLRYQWKKDGVVIGGATTSSYNIPAVASGDMGFYSVTVSDSAGSVDSAVAILTINSGSSRLTSLSTRGVAGAGESALTPGIALRGAGSKPLVIRGVGPTLGSFGVAGTLSDPKLDVIPLGATTSMVSNDDWGMNTNVDELRTEMTTLGAFSLGEGSKDAAVLATLVTPNTVGNYLYTVRITLAGTAAQGIVLAEVYDTEGATAPVELIAVSTRGFTGPGAQVLTPGFWIAGDGPKQLLIRAVGPGLASYGVGGLLADPQFRVVPAGKDYTVASNDNWGGTAELQTAFTQTGAFALPDTASKDAAAIVRLPPGGYTVQATGVGDTTGNVLVEVYDMDPTPAPSGSPAPPPPLPPSPPGGSVPSTQEPPPPPPPRAPPTPSGSSSSSATQQATQQAIQAIQATQQTTSVVPPPAPSGSPAPTPPPPPVSSPPPPPPLPPTIDPTITTPVQPVGG